MREVEFDGEKVTLVPDLNIHEYFRVWCPLCKKENWYWRGRESITAFKCCGCGKLFMEDDECLIDIAEHEGLEVGECREKPYE